MNTAIRFMGLFLIVMGFMLPSLPPEGWADSDSASAQILLIIPERRSPSTPDSLNATTSVPEHAPAPSVQTTTTRVESGGRITLLKTRTESL